MLSNFSYLLISVQRIDNQLHHSANFSLESVFLSLLSKFFHLSHIQTIQFDSFLLPLDSFIICLRSISTFSNIFIYCGWFCLCWFFCLFFFCQAKSCKKKGTEKLSLPWKVWQKSHLKKLIPRTTRQRWCYFNNCTCSPELSRFTQMNLVLHSHTETAISSTFKVSDLNGCFWDGKLLLL